MVFARLRLDLERINQMSTQFKQVGFYADKETLELLKLLPNQSHALRELIKEFLPQYLRNQAEQSLAQVANLRRPR